MRGMTAAFLTGMAAVVLLDWVWFFFCAEEGQRRLRLKFLPWPEDCCLSKVWQAVPGWEEPLLLLFAVGITTIKNSGNLEKRYVRQVFCYLILVSFSQVSDKNSANLPGEFLAFCLDRYCCLYQWCPKVWRLRPCLSIYSSFALYR